MSNRVTVTFAPGQTEAVADDALYQWAYGQVLQIDGLDLPAAYQVDFSNYEFCGDSIPQVGGADGVAIPSGILTTGKPVYAFVWIQTEDGGRTQYRAMIRVVPRPMPDIDDPSPEEESAIAEAIAALNAAVDQTGADAAAASASAQEAAESAQGAAGSATLAESWAVGETGTREGEDVNNARFWALVAQQGAEHSGYAIFDVNDQDGQMYVTITDPLSGDVEFHVNENLGTLEVTING